MAQVLLRDLCIVASTLSGKTSVDWAANNDGGVKWPRFGGPILGVVA